MGCQARNASVAFPACLVAGRLLASAALPVSTSILAAAELLLSACSAHFSAWNFVL